ncbi:MAG: response regulator transcription factor [Actinomycetota bacterium]
MRILVVEDETTVATAVERGLRAEGFEVDVADNGDDGLWMAREGTYDAIVLDIMLPRRNGYLVCRELRAADDWTPVLMLTAKDGELDEAEGLDTGADDYLTKPFSFVVLVARIKALLRRSRASGGAAGGGAGGELVAGDLRLDPVAHRCTRGDAEIALTAREVAVLGFLMRRVGSIVSKQEILDNVWDPAFEGDPNIVEVYVRRLRKKIDEPFGARTITTVRGVGYRIDGDDG